MRLQTSFKAETLPLYYRMGLYRMIKESIRLSNEDYHTRLFQSRSMKPFVYSVFLDGMSLQGDEIKVKGFKLLVSSSDEMFMEHLYKGMTKLENFQHKGHLWERGDIQKLEERKIVGNRVVFGTVSPILIETRHRDSLPPESPHYEKEFNFYANEVVKAMLGRSLKKELAVKPLGMKKVIIKECSEDFAIHGQKETPFYLTPYRGMIEVSGDSEDLMCLYQNGISKKRSFGFGLLKVNREE